jgi:phage shock protein A
LARLDERDRLREVLYDAIAAEHRLQQAAAREEATARRWEERAALADRKEAHDLAEAARQRAAQHQRRARACRAETAHHRTRIAELKLELPRLAATTPRVVVVPPDDVERRLATLERDARLEGDLAELKRQLGRG